MISIIDVVEELNQKIDDIEDKIKNRIGDEWEMVLKRALASIGIGSAKVDTKLEKDEYVQGEEVRGVIEVKGGKVKQDIEAFYLTLHTNYIREVNDRKVHEIVTIGRFKLCEAVTVSANDLIQIPFSFTLPLDTPTSFGRTKVWISTGANIKKAVDPTDRDYMIVHPSPLLQSVIQAMYDLGFQMREAVCEAAPKLLLGRLPFVQEFEFVPYQGEFFGKLDEVEVMILSQTEHQLNVLIEVDRRARFGSLTSLLAEAMDMDETHVRLTLTVDDIPNVGEILYKIINAYS